MGCPRNPQTLSMTVSMGKATQVLNNWLSTRTAEAHSVSCRQPVLSNQLLAQTAKNELAPTLKFLYIHFALYLEPFHDTR